MKKVLLVLPLLLLIACSSTNVSETKSAKAESYAKERESRKAERESIKAEQESNKIAREESKQAKTKAENDLHNKYDRVIVDNSIVKITLTTKMSAHDAMPCVIENKTNDKITIIAFPTLIRTDKTLEEIYNEHSDVFPREIEAKSKVNSTFHITFHNKESLGINSYDDYFDENGHVEFRTTIKVIKSYDGDTAKLTEAMNNPLCDEITQFDVYKCD